MRGHPDSPEPKRNKFYAMGSNGPLNKYVMLTINKVNMTGTKIWIGDKFVDFVHSSAQGSAEFYVFRVSRSLVKCSQW